MRFLPNCPPWRHKLNLPLYTNLIIFNLKYTTSMYGLRYNIILKLMTSKYFNYFSHYIWLWFFINNFLINIKNQSCTWHICNSFILSYFFCVWLFFLFIYILQFQAALLQRWNLPDIMCPFCPFVQYLSVNVSVFTLTAIAVDRHRAILKPLR